MKLCLFLVIAAFVPGGLCRAVPASSNIRSRVDEIDHLGGVLPEYNKHAQMNQFPRSKETLRKPEATPDGGNPIDGARDFSDDGDDDDEDDLPPPPPPSGPPPPPPMPSDLPDYAADLPTSRNSNRRIPPPPSENNSSMDDSEDFPPPPSSMAGDDSSRLDDFDDNDFLPPPPPPPMPAPSTRLETPSPSTTGRRSVPPMRRHPPRLRSTPSTGLQSKMAKYSGADEDMKRPPIQSTGRKVVIKNQGPYFFGRHSQSNQRPSGVDGGAIRRHGY